MYSSDQPAGTENVKFLLPGSRGRPCVDVDRQQLVLLRQQGFTAVQIARHLGCSTSVIYRKLASENLQMRQKYDTMANDQVDELVRDVHDNNASAGQQVH